MKLALDLAVIVALPAPTPVTTPDASTVATAVLLDDQLIAVDTPDAALTVAAIGSVLPISTTPTIGATDTVTGRAANSVTGVLIVSTTVPDRPCFSSRRNRAGPPTSAPPMVEFRLLALMTLDIVQLPTGSVPPGLGGHSTLVPPAADVTSP